MVKHDWAEQRAENESRRSPRLARAFVVCVLLGTIGGQAGLAQDIEVRLTLPKEDRRNIEMHVLFSPDGRTLAFGTRVSALKSWDLAGGKRRRDLVPDLRWAYAGCAAFSPDGKTLAVGNRELGRIRLLDVASGKERGILRRDNPLWASCVAFSPDGKMLAVGDAEGDEALIWNLPTRKVRATLPGHEGRGIKGSVFSLAFSPDGKLLATSGHIPDILLWRVGTGRSYGRLKQAPDEYLTCWHLAFTPDGKHLVGASSSGTVNLWDLSTGKLKATIWKSPENVFAIALSPDGRTLAAVDHTSIHLFDMLTHQERAILHGRIPKHYWASLAFSPDGRTLGAGRGDGCVVLFDLAGVNGVKTPDAAALDRLWSRLGPGDAAGAYRAIRTLSAFPRQTVPFLRQQLRPETPPTALQLRALDRLVPQMDSDDFDERSKASAEVEKSGTWAEAALRREQTRRHSLDFKKRAKALLEHIDRLKASRPLQRLRALEVLEHMDDADVRALLTDLAKTAPEARVRDDAKASLQRVRKRPPPTIIKPLPPEAPPRPKPPPVPARR